MKLKELDTCTEDKYTVIDTETKEGLYYNLTRDTLLETYNSMVSEYNKDCGEHNPLAETVEDVKSFSEEIWGWKIVEESKADNEEVMFITSQALSFNNSWTGRTKKVDGVGYYNFSIKPLYMGKGNILFQVVLNKMCPSGCSDNGIKKSYMYDISQYAFTDINSLCSWLIRISVNSAEYYTEYSKRIDYIQF